MLAHASMGEMDNVRLGPVQAIVMFVTAVTGISIFSYAINGQLTEDCGRVDYSHSDPLLSPTQLIGLSPNCSFSPLVSYRTHTSWIAAKKRPCTLKNTLDAYPAPTCKKGEVVRMTKVIPQMKQGRRIVSVGVLCCPVTDEDDTTLIDDCRNKHKHSSAPTRVNENNEWYNYGDL